MKLFWVLVVFIIALPFIVLAFVAGSCWQGMQWGWWLVGRTFER